MDNGASKYGIGDLISVNGYADETYRIYEVSNVGGYSREFGYYYDRHYLCRRVTDGAQLIVFEEDIVVLVKKEDEKKYNLPLDIPETGSRIVDGYTDDEQDKVNTLLDGLRDIQMVRDIVGDQKYAEENFESICEELSKLSTGG